MSLIARDRVAAALRDEFSAWIAGHPNAGVFDWNVAAENVLRAANPPGAVDRIKALRDRVRPDDPDPREAAYARGYRAAVTDALESLVGGQ